MVNLGGAPHDSDHIQDFWYALDQAGLLSDTISDDIDDAIKTQNYGVQPDGDLVGKQADGLAFAIDGALNADETVTSEWIDTDGFNAIEIVVLSDFESARDGVEIQYTRDAQASPPTVHSKEVETYGANCAQYGCEGFTFGTRLDGFRLKYTNNSSATSSDFAVIATLHTEPHPDSAAYVRSDLYGDSFVSVGTDESINGVKIGSPTSLFQDVETIERRTVVDNTSSFGTSVLRDTVTNTNSGSVQEDPAPTGEIHLSTGTTANSSVELRTTEYGRYTPGFSAQCGTGIRVPTLPTEGEARWGYFDDNDGFYWGYDGSQGEMFVSRRTGGSEMERVYRSNWNRDVIDEELNRSWDPTGGDIYQIDFSWYGFGIVLFSIVTQTQDETRRGNPAQVNVPVHAISVQDSTSISDPNQPITVEVENGSTGEDIDLYVGGRQFSIFGQPPAESRVTSQHNAGTSTDTTSWTYLMSWQRDPTSVANSKVNIEAIKSIQTEDVRLALLIEPNVSSTSYGIPELTASGETLLEVSTVGTFDGIGSGTKIYETMVVGGGGNKSVSGDSDVNARLGEGIELVLVAKNVSKAGSVDVTMSMQEDW